MKKHSIQISAPLYAYHDVSSEFAMVDTMRVFIDGAELSYRYNAPLFEAFRDLINRGECDREHVHAAYDDYTAGKAA